MNTGENKVLLTIELDEQATEKRIIEIRKQLDFLGDTAKDLKKDFKEGAIGSDQYYGALERIKTQSTLLGKELIAQRKSLENNSRAQKAASGSLVELKANLSLTTAAYGQLSREQRNNVEVGGELAKTIKAYSDELKQAEERTGLHTRSVGDYAKGLRVAGISVKEVQEAVSGGVQAFQVFTKGITLSKGALIALSAIPILLLLTGLVALLTRSQAGMDKLAQYTKAVDLAISSLTQGFVKVGQAVADFFSGKTFSSLENFKNAFLGLDKTVRSVGDGMLDAAKAGVEIAKTTQRLADMEQVLDLNRAKSKAEFERLKKIADDTTLSTKTRVDAANKANSIEISSTLKLIALQNLKVANLEREQKITGKTRENQQKINDERIEGFRLEEDIYDRTTELQNTLNAIQKQGREDARKAAILAAQEELARYERILVYAKMKGKETLDVEIAIIQKRLAVDKLGIEKGTQQRKLLEAKAEAEIANLKIDRALELQKKISSIQDSAIASSLAVARKGSKEQNEFLIRQIQQQEKDQIAELEAQRKKKLISEDAYNEKLGEIQATSFRKISDLRVQFAEQEVSRIAEIDKARLQAELDRSENVFETKRQQANELINIEEKQQTDLLALQEIGEKEREAKLEIIRAAADKKRAEVRRQLLQDELTDRIAILDAELEAVKAGSKEEFTYRRSLLKNQLAQELLNFEGSEKQKAALKKKYSALQAKIDKEESKQLVNNIVNATETGLQAVSGFFQAAQQERQNAFDAEQDAAVKSAGDNADLRAAIEKNFAARKAELDKKAANERKKIALAEAAIGIAKGIIAAQELPPPFSFIQAALVGLTGLAQIAVISAQKFNRGGVPNQYHSYQSDGRGAYLATGPGTSTSDSIPAKLSVKESVMNAKATAKYYDTLSAMNAETGGVSFPGAKPISTMPAPVQSFKYGVVGLGQDTGATIGRYVDDAVSRIQPVLVLETLNQVNGRVNRTQVRQTIK